MKKNIQKVIILSLILLVISTIFILVMGKTFHAKFQLFNASPNANYELIMDDNEVLEVLDEKEENGEYLVTLKGKKPGKVFLTLNYDDKKEYKELYVHKTLVITDNTFFGYSSGSEIIPLSLSIILIYILYLLIKRYHESLKENLFQYKNVAYLGMIIFLSSFILINLLSLIRYQGVYATIESVINSTMNLSLFLFPLALITSILATISNIRLIIKEGKSLRNLLGLFLGIFICVLALLPNFAYQILMKMQIVDIYNLNSIGPYLYNFIETMVYLTVAYIECILIGTIVMAIKAIKKKMAYNKDYMLILGCQIKKDGTLPPLLKGRVDRALEFRNEQLKETGKDLIFIPSGGQGPDETISEALAMKNYLLEKGINEKNILLEDKSKNTYENFLFSRKLISKKNANIGFATTNYHVFRAGLLATEQGLNLEGIGSKTKVYFWVNAFIREFIGTLYSERKKHILVFIITLLIILIMITITYFTNNI